MGATFRRWGLILRAGIIEHCFTIEGPRGEFVQLTPAVARHVARAIETSRGVAPARRREALEERTRREEREYDAWAESVLYVSGDFCLWVCS